MVAKALRHTLDKPYFLRSQPQSPLVFMDHGGLEYRPSLQGKKSSDRSIVNAIRSIVNAIPKPRRRKLRNFF